jgi:hypothetical protein
VKEGIFKDGNFVGWWIYMYVVISRIYFYLF